MELPNQFKLSNDAKEALGKQYKYYFSRVFEKKKEATEEFQGYSGPSADEEDKTVESSVLDSNELRQYNYILTAIDLKTLKNWTSIVVKKHFEKVKEIAAEKDVTPSQVALAWVLARGDDVAAIPGTRRSKYLKLNWAAQDIILSKKEKAELDAFSQNFTVVGERY